jgi:GWxTD domain-containing protein
MTKYFRALLGIAVISIAGACSSGKKADSAIKGIARSGEMGGAVKPVAASNEEFSLPTVESKFLDHDAQSTRVYLFVTAYKGRRPVTVSEFREKFNVNYVVYGDYGSRDRLGYGNVVLDEGAVVQSGDQLLVQFDIKKPANKESGVVLSEISESGTLKKSLNDLPVRFSNLRTSDQFGFFGEANGVMLNRNFAAVQEKVVVKSLKGEKRPLYASYYGHSFDPASSPMNTSPRSSARSLTVDSTFQIVSGDVLSFQKPGLYYFVTDTSQQEGVSILITNDRYPKLTYADQLSGPVQYMSTNAEIKNLQAVDDAKKALDRYWLSLMNGHQDLAKSVIKNYYGRVEEANRLFTTYKEGWKTDKGMIFIILGNPDKVQRSRDREVWVYNQRGNANNINFTFNKRSNQFVDNHYELVRYVEYQPIWYPIVEAWRTGNIR